MTPSVVVSAAVEGDSDEAVARRLIEHAGAIPGSIFGKTGKPALHQKINGYNSAARHAPWLVLVDLDDDRDCAPPLRSDWLPHPAEQMCFRVAVRQIEAWLMADGVAMASFLGLSAGMIPAEPERLANAKTELVNLARRSRRRAVTADMVPREGSGRSVGPGYTSRLIEFVQGHWRPAVAATRSESLSRAISCLARLVAEQATPA